ncbi:MAG: aldolase/citrate lyase family protein [Hyphomonadaceae bacterium]
MTLALNQAAQRWRVRLTEDRPVLGVVQTLASTNLVSLAAAAGFDFIIVDDEHGEGDCESHAELLTAIEAGGLLSAVRLKPCDFDGAARYGALGAGALFLANVEGVGDVNRLAEAAASRSGAPLLFAMIESRAGAEDLPGIVAADQLAGLVIGPNDLARDLGQSELQSEALMAVVASIEAEARSHALLLGSGVYPGFTLERLLNAGHDLIVVASDIGAIGKTWTAAIDETRAAVAAWRDGEPPCAD